MLVLKEYCCNRMVNSVATWNTLTARDCKSVLVVDTSSVKSVWTGMSFNNQEMKLSWHTSSWAWVVLEVSTQGSWTSICSQQCSMYWSKEQLLSLEVGSSCPNAGISYLSISYGSYKASSKMPDFPLNLKRILDNKFTSRCLHCKPLKVGTLHPACLVKH